MLFARRAIQRRLNELREPLEEAAVDSLVARLNRPDNHRLAAVWETVVLHALSKHGTLGHEAPLLSGRRPDVHFTAPDLAFIADITTTSDEGLHEKNPYEEFGDLIEQMKNRLGLPIGGVELHVSSREEESSRGTRTILRLPERKHLREFVKSEIEPPLRAQLQSGASVLRIEMDNEKSSFQLTIDPRRSPNSTGSYTLFDIPTIKDRNPLYNALKAKVGQLRGASGLTGIIVGDADSSVLADRRYGGTEISMEAVVQEFLRQYSSIGFVLLLSVREEQVQRWSKSNPPKRWLHSLLVAKEGLIEVEPLTTLVNSIMGELPKPAEMPINAANSAGAPGYGWGHHGSHQMSLSPKTGIRIRISARELMELLAGRRTSKQANDLHGWLDPENRPTSGLPGNPFEAQCREGRLPMAIFVNKTDENDSDDWIEFQFGPSDPAIAPFR
jgi:hypothetical protein